MRVRVDLERCTGHGRCYELAPRVFGEDEEGHCRLLLERVPPELERDAHRGAVNCPEHAIALEED